MVNSWEFAQPGTPDPVFPLYTHTNYLTSAIVPSKDAQGNIVQYSEKPYQPPEAIKVDGTWRYKWLDGKPVEVADKDGAAGQNTNNPVSIFSEHCFVKVGDVYYDPSYGAGPFNSTAAWELASVAGFAYTETKNAGLGQYNGLPLIKKTGIFHVFKHPGGNTASGYLTYPAPLDDPPSLP